MDFIFKDKLGSNFYADSYIAYSPNESQVLYRLKIIKPKFVDEGMKSYLHQQLSYIEQLDIEGVFLPELIEADDTFIIKYAFNEQQTLGEYLKAHLTLSVQQTLELGISLCESLENRHKKTWVHKSIKPNNILYSPDSGKATLLDDLGVITPNQLSRLISDPAYCKESLPYQSPEQCGRVRLNVDYRSDLYSLGCVLYHCIAGAPPLFSDSALDIIHSHLAEIPEVLEKRQPGCPVSLSRIIATLLEKQTEKRYQTAFGLKKDLQTCLKKLASSDSSDFPLKHYDFSNEIVLPSILLGREQEKRNLLNLYQQVCDGKLGVAYVSGLSGIGKSRLVQELEVPILKQQGLFASGKHNQFSKHQPYATIAQAIGKLIRQILTETSEQLEVWKSIILDVVGINGQLLVAVIPDLSLLIGTQPEVSPLPPVEARNRFNTLFCRFMTCLATKDHPLVLFIDDLQWCDDATHDLLEQLFNYPDQHPYLLLILAFRSNEVNDKHRLRLSINLLRKSETLLLEVYLSELDKKTVNEMTAYILNSSPLDTQGITEAIYPTCGGNPLLISESLRWLHHKGGLFSDENRQWHWEEMTLAELQLPDSFLTLLSEKLALLTPESQDILARAALLGARFEVSDLSELHDVPISELMPQLSEIFSQRILIKEKSELCFSHDQIQMAATTLLSPDQAILTHKKIAQHFIQQLDQITNESQVSNQGRLLYSIAEHLKKGRNEQASDIERFEEANINFQAGKVALESLAHSTADYYFSEAVELCTSNDWKYHYDFMLSLYKSYARSALLMGKQVRSSDTINIALKYAKSDLDRAACLFEQTVANTSLGKREEGLVLAQRCCLLLQHPLPESEEAIKAEIAQHVKILQDPLCLKRYRDLPLASNQQALIEFAIYAELLPLSYLSGKTNLFFLCSMRSIILALQKGTSSTTCYSLDTVATFFHFQKNYDLAKQYQTLVFEIADQEPYAFSSIRAIAQGIWLTMHHSHSLSDLQEICRTNIHNGARAGEILYTGLSYIPLIWYQLTKGEDIQEFKYQVREGLNYCEQYDISLPLEMCRAIEAALMPLWGELPAGHQTHMEQKLKQWHEEQHLSALCIYYYFRGVLAYYAGNYAEAELELINAEPFLTAVPGTIIERLWQVYRYLAGLRTGNNPEAQAQIEQVTEWSKYGPVLLPLLALMKAETTAANTRNINDLRTDYWQVIDSAHEHSCHFYEAYAYQRLGEALEQQKHHSSHFYLNEAVRLYTKCNADFFVDILIERFHLTRIPFVENEPGFIEEHLDQSLDSTFLLEATESFMKERDYSALLFKILTSMMARVGAKNAYLITLEDEKLSVRAHGRKKITVETSRLNQDISTTEKLCPEIARFVVRSQSPIVLGNASQTGDYCHSQAVQHYQLKSVLALPLMAQGRALGLIYLENSLITNVFSDEQVSLLQVLTTQAAIALDNSLLISNLQRTQNTLIQREQNLAITLNSIGDGVIVTDQSGNIARLNPIAEKLTGWTISQAKGKPIRSIFKIVDATTREPLLNPVDKVLSTGEIVYLSNHTTLISRDSQEYQIADSAAPIRSGDDNILGMVLVFNDVTEAYNLRKEVAESHLRLEQVMGDMHAMVATLCPEGGITFVNKKPLTLGGLDFKSVLNQRLWNSPWFNYDEKIQQEVKQACLSAAKGQEINQDLQMQTLDGPIWIEFGLHPIKEESGNINLLVWEGRDISSRKLAERKLKDEQVLQALTLDNLADAVIIADDRGMIRRFNKSACQIFGYSDQEIINQNINILMEVDDAKMHHIFLENYHLTSRPTILGKGRRVTAKRKNGEIFPLHISVAELPEMIDGQKQFVASAQDLTTRELQQEMLQRSQKMEALGKLTGGIAHDYNNMLGVIMGYCELLEPALAETSKQLGFLKQVQHAAKRGAMLTQKLLSYSRQKPSQSDSVNINEFLRSQQEMLEKTLTARIQLTLELNENTFNIDVNLGDLEDAILNLCINAMHAMPDGGHLKIKVEFQEILDQDADTHQVNSGEYVVISISDTGIGMDKDIQNKIFDPFFSTKGELGTGLGLSQVYGFMERSHGVIKVYSELGYGSRFSLYFPLAKSHNITNQESSNFKTNRNFSGTESILVVDDEPALLELIKEILKEQGFFVFCAKNAENAMEIIKSQHVDLVLSDIIMPETNGYQLAKYIQQYDPNITIQLMSGFDDEFEIDENNLSLHCGQLTKPIRRQALLSRVKELLSTNRALKVDSLNSENEIEL